MNRKQKTRAQAASLDQGESAADKFELKRQPLLCHVRWDSVRLSASADEELLLGTEYFSLKRLKMRRILTRRSSPESSLLQRARLFLLQGRVLWATGQSIEVLQVLNCFISAVCAYVLFRILLDCLKSIYLSAILTLLFAFRDVVEILDRCRQLHPKRLLSARQLLPDSSTSQAEAFSLGRRSRLEHVFSSTGNSLLSGHRPRHSSANFLAAC